MANTPPTAATAPAKVESAATREKKLPQRVRHASARRQPRKRREWLHRKGRL